MQSIFTSEELQNKFNEAGFVKISFLNQDQIHELLALYEKSHASEEKGRGFFISLDNEDSGKVNGISNSIKKVMKSSAELVFENSKIFTASFVIKEPGLKYIVPPHQDWTFVDENEYNSMTVWVPLIDVNEDNGALSVIPGSHKLFHHHRSSPSPQSKSPLADHIFTLFPFVKVIDMKAGEALVFDNRLIHASPPNTSGSNRIAVGIGITQNSADLIHYYHVPATNRIKKYAVDESFYNFYNNKRLSDYFDSGVCPEGLKELDEIERIVPELSKDQMVAKVNELDNVEYNKKLMNKLAALFNYNTEKEEEKKDQVNIEEDEIEEVWRDERTFFEKYTPANIIREVIWRAKGRPNA